MKTLILIALVAYLTMSSLARQNERARSKCTNPLPGVKKLIRGVDITKLDMMPLHDTGDRGFRYPILEFTCDIGKKWHNPDTCNGKQYQEPDQVLHADTIPTGMMDSGAKLYKSSSDVRKEKSVTVGVTGAFKKFSFSSSVSYRDMQNTITNESRYIFDQRYVESATEVILSPSFKMNRFAKSMLKREVTGNFSTNPNGYRNFINKFGTHYFSEGKFGGLIRVIYETDTSYFSSKSEKEVKVEAEAAFTGVISAKASHGTSTSEENQTFLEKSTKRMRYCGGNTNLLKTNGIEQWQPTVDKDPCLFSGKLELISDLIQDETTKSSMEEAVTQYVLEEYLKELERIVYDAMLKMDKLPDRSLKNIAAALFGRVKTMQIHAAVTLDRLVERYVETLNDDIQRELVVPDWFRTNTQFCYKWWTKMEASRGCGSVPRNQLCAKPNDITPYYRGPNFEDILNIFLSSCIMRWGIKSVDYPSWFSEVKVCFKWYGDECIGNGERCASVNSFTSEYEAYAVPECYLNWKLEVPNNAPLWMKTSKLCYSYQCDQGDFAPPQVCALPGHWINNTYSLNCQMRWGITLTL